MAQLTVTNIHKHYGQGTLLAGVSLQIDDGDRLGLVGRNGCGKSTLLRIMAGVEAADEGERAVARGAKIGYLAQEPTLPEDANLRQAVREGLAGRDVVLVEMERATTALSSAGLDKAGERAALRRIAELEDRLEALGGHDVDHRVETLLNHVGMPDHDAICGQLSGGERRRVALARVLLAQPDVLLLDEPTNHLDAFVTDWLEDHLLALRIPLALVTHDRYVLDRVATRIVELDRGTLHSYEGNYASYLEQRAARLDAEGSVESARQNLLRRETAWMRRGPPARTTKAKARIDRYEAIVDSAPAKARGDVDFVIPSGPRLGDRVLRIEGVHKKLGERTLLRDFHLELEKGERLGIVGPNGAGKSTLLNVATGKLAPDRGTVKVGPTVKFAIADQLMETLHPDNTVLEEVAAWCDHVNVGGQSQRVETFLDRFQFTAAAMRTRVGDLSGGERHRVQLAKLLLANGNVLVLDEPTNDLDLETLRVLEEALVDFPGSALIVSHDRFFLDRVATKIVALDGSGDIRQHVGDVSALIDQLRDERTERRRKADAKPKQAKPQAPTRPRTRLTNWQRKELDELPDKIDAAEQALVAFDERLADPALYAGGADPARLSKLQSERDAASDNLDTLNARWEELAAIDEQE